MTDDELFDYFRAHAGPNGVPHFAPGGDPKKTYFAFCGTPSQYTEFVLEVARHLELYDSARIEQAMYYVKTYTASAKNAKHYVFMNLRTRKITVNTMELERNDDS